MEKINPDKAQVLVDYLSEKFIGKMIKELPSIDSDSTKYGIIVGVSYTNPKWFTVEFLLGEEKRTLTSNSPGELIDLVSNSVYDL